MNSTPMKESADQVTSVTVRAPFARPSRQRPASMVWTSTFTPIWLQ
ncbi:hypothetical protein VXJ24_01945 [Olsenella sp. YH-ols2221]